jgi:NAD(P)-dependent dehydrogenase (short-subunit alcohol dehydrogenase family)
MSFIDVSGKVAVVTGASRGIGEAAARRLAASGAKVVLAARKLEPLEAVAERIRADGGDARAVACHTGRADEIDALVQAAVDAYGQVDVLVNNAATNPYFGPMLETEDAAWDKTFEVNVKGYFAACRAVARHLEARGAPGSLINLTSVLGQRAAPFQGAYAMTKAAVISMTQTLAVELGAHGIRVNAIAPGIVETRFSKVLVETEFIAKTLKERTPLGRFGQPDDVAGLVVYLASDAAAYCTGQVFTVDGGLSAQL